MNFRCFLYFCVFAIPFFPQGVGFYFGEGLPTLDLPRILMIILIFFWFLRKTVSGERLQLPKGGITTFLLLLILAQFISIFIADKFVQSAMIWLGYVLYYYIIFFILCDQIKTEEEWKKVLKVTIALGICLGIVAIIEFISQRGIYDQFRSAWLTNPAADFRSDIWRIEGVAASKGPYGSSQSLGFFFSIIFFLVLNNFLSEKRLSSKIIKLLSVVIVALGLLTTQVRAAIIAVIVSFILSFVLQKLSFKQIKNIVLTSIIIFIAIVIIAQIVPAGFWKYTFIDSVVKIDRQQSTFYKRVDGLSITLTDIAERPILGYGTGAVIKHIAQISKFKLRSDLPLAIVFYIESGLFGFLAFCGLAYHLLRSLWRFHVKHKTEMQPFYVLLGLIAYLISTASAPQLESSFVFFVLLAYSAFLTRQKTITVSIL